ncbi:MAG: PIG-L family deacetylase [Victivallaceae bacterium]|nr:PIG-L family deacetylase [Victivallaceae bacterium]
MNKKLRVMSIMAHQDDFEFNAGGFFALLRKHYGEQVELKIVTTSTGASGHHKMDLASTAKRRDQEARNSAKKINAAYECLRQLDGKHVDGQVMIERNLLGGLWNTIREFEPDYIFCPPVISDPLAGIHIDHYHTAQAVRLVAYQLCVPHAYPTMAGKVKQRVKVPIIINVDDVYTNGGDYHFSCDISGVYELKAAMAACHKSQIYEWLPFVDGRDEPLTHAEWQEKFRKRHIAVNQRYQQPADSPREFFRITQWGGAWDIEKIGQDFPFHCLKKRND